MTQRVKRMSRNAKSFLVNTKAELAAVQTSISREIVNYLTRFLVSRGLAFSFAEVPDLTVVTHQIKNCAVHPMVYVCSAHLSSLSLD